MGWATVRSRGSGNSSIVRRVIVQFFLTSRAKGAFFLTSVYDTTSDPGVPSTNGHHIEQDGGRKVIRQIFAAALGFGLVLSVAAQDTLLRDGHPDEYVVQQGDTLWDIAARFLHNPWDWPAIWQANPQIDNPHLIFPGDLISLIYVDGQPRLAINRAGDGGEDRLSPRIRELDDGEAITTVPLDAIDDFLRYPRIIGEEEYESLPYVLANNKRQLNAIPGNNTYVRHLDAPEGSEVVLSRLNYIYRDAESDEPDRRDFRTYKVHDRFYMANRVHHRDPVIWRWVAGLFGDDWPVIGYELWEVARARVIKAGDPAILQIIEGRQEVNVGDLVLPIDQHIYDARFYPSAMDDVPEGARVLTVSENRYHADHFRIVALNIGTDDGVRTGHTFSVFHPGDKVHDTREHPNSRINPFTDKVKLPDEYVAQVMVFRTFERISYAMVMGGRRAVQEMDILRHADERL